MYRKDSKKGSCQKVKNLDIYGQNISLTFKRKKEFNSWFGFCVTIVTFVLFIGFTIMSTQKLVSRSDPFLSTNTMPREDSFAMDLAELGYVFAV